MFGDLFRRHSKMIWHSDRMLLDGLVFRLEQAKNENWDLGEDCFVLHKLKPLMDQYDAYFKNKKFSPKNMFEIGMWDGGSAALWFNYFKLQKYAAIDISTRGDSEYFKKFIASRKLEDRVKLYWGMDQSSTENIKEIVSKEFSEPLDLVIDDGGHIYSETKKSFESLFPFLRPGGLYMIEDWAWPHWKGFNEGPTGTEPTKLITEFAEAVGSTPEIFEELEVLPGFAVIKRGPLAIDPNSSFSLGSHIHRR